MKQGRSDEKDVKSQRPTNFRLRRAARPASASRERVAVAGSGMCRVPSLAFSVATKEALPRAAAWLISVTLPKVYFCCYPFVQQMGEPELMLV